MNCFGYMFIFKERFCFYCEFLIWMVEFGQVYCYEFSGVFNGFFCVRFFCQDDVYIFVMLDQIESEIVLVLQLIYEVYIVFGFFYDIELLMRLEDYMGSECLWDWVESVLERVLKEQGYDFWFNWGDGVFYGLKIDIYIKDVLN